MSADPSFLMKSTVQSRGEATALLHNPGDAVLVERGRPRWLLLKCPCGCGEVIPINLDKRAGPAWRLYRSKRYGYSVHPSVWRDTGCESHFIIWRNRILLLGKRYGGYRSLAAREEITALGEQVYAALPENEFTYYVVIADTIREVPWEVLDACRYLVREGLALEHETDERGLFRRRNRPARKESFSQYV